MPTKKKKPFYRLIKKIVGSFYKRRIFEGIENLPNEPCVFVGNHSKTHGPLMAELYFPREKYIWCIGQMMNVKEAPKYAFNDFWSKKPAGIRWLYKCLSYIIAPISAYLFTNADCIAVYKDMRVMTTYKDSVKGLEEGKNIIIFPEHHVYYNNIINDFQERFVDVARLYYQRNKKAIAFVPMYHAVKLKKVVFGTPYYYNPEISIDEQRRIIVKYLKEEITRLARSLPKHKVVPYENMGRRKYVTNLCDEELVNNSEKI